MQQFTVYTPRNSGPLMLDVQTDLLEPLNTRVVVPLIPIAEAPKPAHRLNPIFTVADAHVVMMTQFLSAVKVAELGAPTARLTAEQDDIKAALDMLFHGF